MNIESRASRVCMAITTSACIVLGLFGLIFAFASKIPFMTEFFNQFYSPFFGAAGPDAATDSMLVFVQGVLGAVMLSWGFVLTLIAIIPLRRGENWAWWALVGASLSWFLIDESFSIATGVWVNAIGNIFLLAWLIAPLIILRLVSARLRND